MRQPPDSFRSRLDPGIEEIFVELWNPVNASAAAETIASFYLSTWDDPTPVWAWQGKEAGDVAIHHAQDAMSGKVLPNTLESIALTFSIQGLTRATTHQLVRSRVGAVFGQQGGRDNNWGEFNFRVPDTFAGAMGIDTIRGLIGRMNEIYTELIAAGVPFQDARYVLPMGLETSLVASYNLLSFKGLASRRLCNRMMWETNYVVRVMADLVVQAFPFVGRNLRSSCERSGVCGSVSTMFPPADQTMVQVGQGRDNVKRWVVEYAKDNRILKDQLHQMDRYDNAQEANGTYIHFDRIDRLRLEREQEEPDVVLSLVDGTTALAIRTEGIWENV